MYNYKNRVLACFQTRAVMPKQGEPELTDPFNLLINVKLRMLWN